MEVLRKGFLKHGHARRGRRTRVHYLWKEIKKRCYDSHCEDFHLYGGRGISVYTPWIKSFPSFLAYLLATIGLPPGDGRSLDRINNDRGYEPGNLKWSTPTEQAGNTRANRIVTIDGITGHLAGVCRELGLSPNRMYRLMGPGSVKRTPQEAADHIRNPVPRSEACIVTIDGITGYLAEVCRNLGLSYARVRSLIRGRHIKRDPQAAADYVRKYPVPFTLEHKEAIWAVQKALRVARKKRY